MQYLHGRFNFFFNILIYFHTLGVYFIPYNERNVLGVISTSGLPAVLFTEVGRDWNASLSIRSIHSRFSLCIVFFMYYL